MINTAAKMRINVFFLGRLGEEAMTQYLSRRLFDGLFGAVRGRGRPVG